MDKFNFKAYIANNPLLKEQEELNPLDIGNDMAELAGELNDAIEDELENKEEEIKEALDPASLISYLLASTTIVNIISKQAMKIAKKL